MKSLQVNNRASRLRFPNVVIDSFEVRAMPIDELWPPVRVVPVFVEELKDSIAQAGLMNPIIVVRTPKEDLVRHFEKKNKLFPNWKHPPLPDGEVTNTIWGGSNRLEAVKQLGYTHVDCVLIPDFFTAMEVQTQQRNAYGDSNGSAGATA